MAAGDLGNTDPYLLPQTPSVLSVGLKCMNQGYDFIWYAKDKPFFVKPDGTRIYLKVRDYPYYDVWDGDSAMACPAKGTPQSRPEGQVGRSSASSESSYSSSEQTEDAAGEEYTPSIAPLEDPEVHARVVAELLADEPIEVKPDEHAEPIESKDLAGEDVVGNPEKLLRLLHMWAWKYVLKDEILDMLLAHKSLPCEDAKRIREKLSTQETWRKAMAGGLLFSRETLDNIPDNELDPSILTAIGDSSVAHDIVMIWTWRRGKSVKVVANKSWLGALQPASQEAAEFLADLIYTKKYDEKVKTVLHTNFDVNALLEREVLKPIWDKLTKKADKTAAATQAESADEGALDDRPCESRHPPFRAQ